MGINVPMHIFISNGLDAVCWRYLFFIYNAFFCKSFTKISATAQINFFIYRIKLYPKVWDIRPKL